MVKRCAFARPDLRDQNVNIVMNCNAKMMAFVEKINLAMLDANVQQNLKVFVARTVHAKVSVAVTVSARCIWAVHNAIVIKTIGVDNVNQKNAQTIAKMAEHARSIRLMIKSVSVHRIIRANDVKFSVN